MTDKALHKAFIPKVNINRGYGKGIVIMTSKEQLEREVKHYAETLEELVSGDCEWFYNDYCDTDEEREEYADSYARLSKYFEYVLDVEIICDLRGEYRGAKIWLVLGGPGICLDTREGWVKGYWWGDRAEWHVQRQTVAAVDEYFSEIWEMSRGC